MKIHVCFTPAEYTPEAVGEHYAVAIDVLRATSSIATAFHNGCAAFIPVETVEAAQAEKAKHPTALMAGERQGLLIPGFDLGNSPFEYDAATVAGQTIIMTTTNGTIALKRAQSACGVYPASFLNANSVCNALKAAGKDVVIICAGSDGGFSLEDTLCAGLLVERLHEGAVLSDTAMAVRSMYLGTQADVRGTICASSHAAYLTGLGFDRDVQRCLDMDCYDVAPVFCDGVIRL